jgi:hypothetical protein
VAGSPLVIFPIEKSSLSLTRVAIWAPTVAGNTWVVLLLESSTLVLMVMVIFLIEKTTLLPTRIAI